MYTLKGKYNNNNNNNNTVVFLNDKEVSLEKSLKIYNHSPTGFSWGYNGSGPAQLALAVCIEVYGEREALYKYQDFKRSVISNLNHQKDFEIKLDKDLTQITKIIALTNPSDTINLKTPLKVFEKVSKLKKLLKPIKINKKINLIDELLKKLKEVHFIISEGFSLEDHSHIDINCSLKCDIGLELNASVGIRGSRKIIDGEMADGSSVYDGFGSEITNLTEFLENINLSDKINFTSIHLSQVIGDSCCVFDYKLSAIQVN